MFWVQVDEGVGVYWDLGFGNLELAAEVGGVVICEWRWRWVVDVDVGKWMGICECGLGFFIFIFIFYFLSSLFFIIFLGDVWDFTATATGLS